MTDEGRSTCPTCGGELSSKYCQACGEKRLSKNDLTFRHLIEQAIETVSNTDGRVFRSFRDLALRPGGLTASYIHGRRKPYIGPLQMFLIANVIFFAVQSLSGWRMATAPAVCDLLRALVAAHDAPLVLKVDNGSAFTSHQLRTWADAVGTRLLYSPPRYPRYNGSIEASIGALATRAHHAAAAAGHPEYWTTDDVEGARAQANLTIRSGGGSQTAAQRWHDSPPITATERRRFGAHYTAAIANEHGAIKRVQQRHAIVDTLRTLGYVTMNRRTDLVHPLTNEKRQTLRA